MNNKYHSMLIVVGAIICVIVLLMTAIFIWYPKAYVAYASNFQLRYFAVLRWEAEAPKDDDPREQYQKTLVADDLLRNRVFIFNSIRKDDIPNKSLGLFTVSSILEKNFVNIEFDEVEVRAIKEAMSDPVVGSAAFSLAVRYSGHSKQGVLMLIDGLIANNIDCRVNCMNYLSRTQPGEYSEKITKNVSKAYSLYGSGAFADAAVPIIYVPKEDNQLKAIRKDRTNKSNAP